MGREITSGIVLEVNKGNDVAKFNLRTKHDQSGAGSGNPGLLDLTTAETSVSFGNLSPGYVSLVTLSTSATVRYGPDSTGLVQFAELPPVHGKGLIYLSTATTMIMRTASGSASVRVSAVEK